MHVLMEYLLYRIRQQVRKVSLLKQQLRKCRLGKCVMFHEYIEKNVWISVSLSRVFWNFEYLLALV